MAAAIRPPSARFVALAEMTSRLSPGTPAHRTPPPAYLTRLWDTHSLPAPPRRYHRPAHLLLLPAAAMERQHQRPLALRLREAIQQPRRQILAQCPRVPKQHPAARAQLRVARPRCRLRLRRRVLPLRPTLRA